MVLFASKVVGLCVAWTVSAQVRGKDVYLYDARALDDTYKQSSLENEIQLEYPSAYKLQTAAVLKFPVVHTVSIDSMHVFSPSPL